MWKIWGARCLYHSVGQIRVSENLVYRWLQFDSSAIQTLISRRKPYKPQLHYIKPLILASILQPGTTCMFGLGGGGAAHALLPYLQKNELLVVEKSAEVIEVAKQFFMFERLVNMQLLNQDAYSFAANSSKTWQNLIMDLFTAKDFPKDCATELFFSHCKRLLKPNGILSVNIANVHEHWPLFKLIQQQFNRSTLVLLLKESANIIIIAQNGSSIRPFIELLQQNKWLISFTWDSDWGYLGQLK